MTGGAGERVCERCVIRYAVEDHVKRGVADDGGEDVRKRARSPRRRVQGAGGDLCKIDE